MSKLIHPAAVVSPKAQLGKEVQVGPYAVIEDDVVIDDGCEVHAFAQVKRFCRLGRANVIHSYALVGGDPQHLAFSGEETWLEMGAGNVVREFVTIHRGSPDGPGKTLIGSNNMFMAYSHVAHDCKIGNNVVLANTVNLAGHVNVGDKAIISGMTGIHQFVRIGENAFVGAMSGFGQDIPPYTIASGVRGTLHGINIIGLRRAGFPRETIKALKKAYQILFRSELMREEALADVAARFPDIPEVGRLLEFVRGSERGITPSASNGKGLD